MRKVLVKSSVLAVCSTLFAIPYFYHLILLTPVMAPFLLRLGLRGFLIMELFMLFILSLLCSIVGFSFSKKRGIPGFGDKTPFARSIPLLLFLAAIMTALSYFLFDRFFFRISPASYPKNILYLVSFPLKAAFTEEVILRFALVTIGIGIFRSRVAGVLFSSAIGVLFTMKYFQFVGMSFRLNYLIITALLISFIYNLILGYVYVSRGLIYSMSLNFLFNMKYAVVSLTI